ncbi:MAG: Flp pilus assembly protein CpaB [Cohaesibacter sp.]|nr:Flp pilus assembly protein CpaB [Cohaesibacter sp.]MCV6601676.1 Flp pilus assembly protein CpaB [Cohaesibacter sp.]
MRVARIAVIVVAVLAGLIAMILAKSMTAPAPREEAALQEPSPALDVVEVLTASSAIPLGTSLTAEHFAWTKWPTESATEGYIRKDERPDADSDLVGAVARSSFIPGEPIKDGKIALVGQGFMSAILPKGRRAIATRISAETSAGGFILPRDRVDVILTEEGEKGVSSETILRNIRVLAIDQNVEEQDGEKVVVGETATLELLPQQGEILATAQRQGTLSLVLRSLEDAESDSEQEAVNSGTIVMVRSGVISKSTVKQ